MKVGLYAPDSKIPNLPLMKLSAFHKSKGDDVSFFSPLLNGSYDIVYVSKVFNKKIYYTPHSNKVVYGGSGYALKTSLPYEIEHIYPDYSLYGIDYAMGFVTRGCNNNCPFCIVSKKEGPLHFNAKIEEFWNGQKEIVLLDNCINECPEAYPELIKIRDNKIKLELSQGFNVRTITPEFASIIADIHTRKQGWYLAWDNIEDEKEIMKGIDILFNAGILGWKLTCYVLVGYNTTLEQDLYRINKLKELKMNPFVMMYNKTEILKKLAHWCNRKAIFESCTFEAFIGEGNE